MNNKDKQKRYDKADNEARLIEKYISSNFPEKLEFFINFTYFDVGKQYGSLKLKPLDNQVLGDFMMTSKYPMIFDFQHSFELINSNEGYVSSNKINNCNSDFFIFLNEQKIGDSKIITTQTVKAYLLKTPLIKLPLGDDGYKFGKYLKTLKKYKSLDKFVLEIIKKFIQQQKETEKINNKLKETKEKFNVN